MILSICGKIWTRKSPYFDILRNSRVLLSNMAKVFLHFWCHIWNFFSLEETLHLGKFQGADFKYDNMTIFFKIAVQKMLIESIFRAKYLDFYFCTKLCCDIFGSANLKYGNRFSKLQPKNSPARSFWYRSWKFFALRETLQFKMFESAGIK